MHLFHALAALAMVSVTFVQPSDTPPLGTPQSSIIHGRVEDHEAKAIDGATVFVYTAAPRVGTSSL